MLGWINENRFLFVSMSSLHDTMSSESRHINGAEIFFTRAGRGSHVIMLLPGLVGCAQTDFMQQLEGLNHDLFTLIAWDPRGYGRSQNSPRDWDATDNFYERDADDAATLMKMIGFERYSVVGWSDGGMTALIMAAKYPDAVHKCVALAANAYITKEEAMGMDVFSDISQMSERMRNIYAAVYGESKLQKLYTESVKAMQKIYWNRDGNICKDFLPNIPCPVLIIQGEKDVLVPMFHAEYLVDNIKNSRLVKFEDGKHNLHWKYAKEFNNLVETFLMDSSNDSKL